MSIEDLADIYIAMLPALAVSIRLFIPWGGGDFLSRNMSKCANNYFADCRLLPRLHQELLSQCLIEFRSMEGE